MYYPPATYTSIRSGRISDLREAPTEWLWGGWLPLGTLTILEGDPEIGKSLLTLDLCTRLSTGRAWPDGQAAGLPCNVVLLSAEDDFRRTVKSRLRAMAANMDRIHFLEGVVGKWGDEPIRLPTHMPALRDVVIQAQAKLVVIDPLLAFFDRGFHPHNEQSVRFVLGTLDALAAEQGCAILLLRHLNKSIGQSALYRGGGSIAFIAVVRVAWLAACDPEQPGRRVLAQAKNNLRERAGSLAYEVGKLSAADVKLTWAGPSPFSSQELLERKRPNHRPPTLRLRGRSACKLF
jgi:RecA-family ATPase